MYGSERVGRRAGSAPRLEPGRPVDGIIGMDFLEESSALLDTASQLLYLGDPPRSRLN